MAVAVGADIAGEDRGVVIEKGPGTGGARGQIVIARELAVGDPLDEQPVGAFSFQAQQAQLQPITEHYHRQQVQYRSEHDAGLRPRRPPSAVAQFHQANSSPHSGYNARYRHEALPGRSGVGLPGPAPRMSAQAPQPRQPVEPYHQAIQQRPAHKQAARRHAPGTGPCFGCIRQGTLSK